jgi:putative membrane protein
MRAVFWLVVVLAAVVLALFAVSNRETVSLGLWPLPFLVEVPIYLLVLAMLVAGFLVGELAGWITGRYWRREARRRARRIAALERELAATQTQLMTPHPAVPARR